MAGTTTNQASSLISAVASLIGALAWPAIALLIMIFEYNKSDIFIAKIDKLMENSQSAKFSFGPGGVSAELTANRAAKAVIESVEKSTNTTINSVQALDINKSALNAVDALHGLPSTPQDRFKLLRVDDHPENNIGLQYAFQTLGMIVVTIDSNDAIRQAFYTSGGFNVVITDMHRDGIAGRTEPQPLAGLETLKAIHNDHPGVPVIIYAGQYASDHERDPVQSPLIRITNDPQQVFSDVTALAQKKSISGI